MRIERVEFYCDYCGCGDDGHGNVEYLGWVFLSGFTMGVIGAPDKEFHFCYNCYPKFVIFVGKAEE